MAEETELDKAKINLYHLLLIKPAIEWSKNEEDIGFLLCMEPCVQNRLRTILTGKEG